MINGLQYATRLAATRKYRPSESENSKRLLNPIVTTRGSFLLGPYGISFKTSILAVQTTCLVFRAFAKRSSLESIFKISVFLWKRKILFNSLRANAALNLKITIFKWRPRKRTYLGIQKKTWNTVIFWYTLNPTFECRRRIYKLRFV